MRRDCRCGREHAERKEQCHPRRRHRHGTDAAPLYGRLWAGLREPHVFPGCLVPVLHQCLLHCLVLVPGLQSPESTASWQYCRGPFPQTTPCLGHTGPLDHHPQYLPGPSDGKRRPPGSPGQVVHPDGHAVRENQRRIVCTERRYLDGRPRRGGLDRRTNRAAKNSHEPLSPPARHNPLHHPGKPEPEHRGSAAVDQCPHRKTGQSRQRSLLQDADQQILPGLRTRSG